MAKTIFISTGEASGDLHAANLVKNFNRITDEKVTYFGMGGKLMQAAGVNIIMPFDQLSIIGITGIITKLPQILRNFYGIKKFLRQNQPDLVILVDYPGFNLRLAKTAKKLGLKVLYYISPQLWAWHQSRVKIIQRYVDRIAVFFPFEVDFYRQFNVSAMLVRHPLLDTVKATMTKNAAQQALHLKPTITIGLLPGSRHCEIKALMPCLNATIHLLKNYNNQWQFVVPLAATLNPSDIEPYLSPEHQVHIIPSSYEVMQACDVMIACSGTVTLEVTLLAIPMVIVYRVSLLNYWLGKLLIKVPYLGLCNMIAQEQVAVELLQQHATPSKIAAEVIKILENKEYRQAMLTKFAMLKHQLAQAHKNIAEVVKEILI